MPYSFDRRRFVGAAAMTLAASQLEATGVAQAQSPAVGGAKSQATTTESRRAFPRLKQAKAGLLNVSYVEEGPADGPAVILLHGWPGSSTSLRVRSENTSFGSTISASSL